MLNYREYARTAEYKRAAVLIECAVNTMPQASDDRKNRVLAGTKNNVDNATRTREGVGGITRAKANVGGITRVKKGE